ncbi:MAG: hypothetical protein AAFY48_20340 [Bacteroidota bacterium]
MSAKNKYFIGTSVDQYRFVGVLAFLVLVRDFRLYQSPVYAMLDGR